MALGEPPRPPLIVPAREPRAWDEEFDPLPEWDLIAQQDPGFEFHQRVSW